MIDTHRRLVLCLAGSRLFVMHTDKPGWWGEVCDCQAHGLLRMDDYVGWYGNDGAWILGSLDYDDLALDGTLTPFTGVYDTWDELPNSEGDGRAFLSHTTLRVRGSSRANATYQVTVDGIESASEEISLTDEYPPRWTDNITGIDGQVWPTRSARRETAPALTGESFQHKLSAPCYMELLNFAPHYQFGGDN